MTKARQADAPLELTNADLVACEAELCRRSLSEFTRGAWHVLEPRTELKWNWHIDAICEHLEAFTRREIPNLIINVPFRCMKSLTSSVFWPAWVWVDHPEARFLLSSYAETLSVRDALKMRRLIQSPWYQARFGDRFQLTSDQNAKKRFENDKTGYRLAASVDGQGIGEGGDYVGADDPLNVRRSLSERELEKTLIWWDETMSTRLNDPELGGLLIVMQRLHEKDPTGHALAQGGYEHLMLPMEYEPDRARTTSIGYQDPRTKSGEPLWPERFTPAVIEGLKNRLGPYGYAGQAQQRPAPRGGGMFKADDFEVVGVDDVTWSDVVDWVRYWDKAATQDGGAYTAGVKMGKLRDGRFVVADVRRGRWSSGRREEMIRAAAEDDGYGVRVYLEQEPGSGGKDSARASVANLAGFDAHARAKRIDKESAAEPYAAQVEGNNVLVVRASWTDEFLREHGAFPRGQFKDQVDAAAGGFNELNMRRERQPGGAPEVLGG